MGICLSAKPISESDDNTGITRLTFLLMRQYGGSFWVFSSFFCHFPIIFRFLIYLLKFCFQQVSFKSEEGVEECPL